MNKGRFITVEGIDGAGKSTHIKTICDLLSSEGIDFITTREPGGTALGESLRELLLNKKEIRIDPLAELLIIYTARAQHISEIITPALSRGIWVISDRFADATYAYQGGGRDLITTTIDQLKELVHADLTPNLTLLFDLDIEIGLARVDQRSNRRDRFEEQDVKFKNRVRVNYLALAKSEADRIKVINADHSIQKVSDQVTKIMETFIAND